MKHGSLNLLMIFFVVSLVTPAWGAIEGTYSGNFLTGKQGGAAYSYIHESTTAKKMGNAGYYQKAGGAVIFAIDVRDGVSFSVTDNGAAGLDAGDLINLNFQVDLLRFDGSFNGSNDLGAGVVATFTVEGSLTVGGTAVNEHSTSFTNGIRNITAADTSSTFAGLDYTIDVISDFSINGNDYFDGDSFSGDAFFQSGDLAGPFNGISYDDQTGTLSFAVWGDSRNKNSTDPYDNHNTGTFTPYGGSAVGDPLGFDLYIEAQIVPEATSLLAWGLLTCFGLTFAKRRDSAKRRNVA